MKWICVKYDLLLHSKYMNFFCPPLSLNHKVQSILLYTFELRLSFNLLRTELVMSPLFAFSIASGPLAKHVRLWRANTGNMENLCGATPGFVACRLTKDTAFLTGDVMWRQMWGFGGWKACVLS